MKNVSLKKVVRLHAEVCALYKENRFREGGILANKHKRDILTKYAPVSLLGRKRRIKAYELITRII